MKIQTQSFTPSIISHGGDECNEMGEYVQGDVKQDEVFDRNWNEGCTG
jgi:hypothetical protein